jgi:hypothetical protein
MSEAVLAQSGGSGTGEVLIWVAVLIGLILIASIAVLILRRRLFAPDTSDDHGASMMETLRRMRDRGEISDAEFEKTRTVMIERATRRRDGSGGASPSVSPTARSNPGPAIADHRVAGPGVDLTGEPLPDPAERPDNPDAPASSGRPG